MVRKLLLVAAVSFIGCGGSSSETPWPAEPETPALGPAGESTSNVIDERQPPDAGTAEEPTRSKKRAKSPE